MERLFFNEINYLRLLSDTSPDKNIRDACNNAVAELLRFAIETK